LSNALHLTLLILSRTKHRFSYTMHITYILPDLNTACSSAQKLDVSTTAANAPVAEMNCSEESDSFTPEPEATTVFWEDVPPVAKKAEQSVTKATADLQTDYFCIKELIGHRRDPTCDTLFEINVRWEGDEETWEPESNLQKDAALTLFAYWS
ncbi:chromo domain-containing protein, partial [Colletotrichum incanum]